MGRALVPKLVALFGEVAVFSRRARPEEAPLPVHGWEEFDPSAFDAIFVCVPDAPETRALFGTEFFGRLRPRAQLINVGRGGLFDERELLAFLSANPRARYAADVASPEPYPSDGDLYRSPQVLLTPHLGGRRADLWPGLVARTLTLLPEFFP